MYTRKTFLFATAALTVATACTFTPFDEKEDAVEAIEVSQGLERALSYDARVSGELSTVSPLDLYEFEAEAGDQQFIDAPSREGDDMVAFLYQLRNGGWEAIAGNDDCSDQTRNACINYTVEVDGTYAVLVTTYQFARFAAPAPATYELEVFCQGGPCADDELEQPPQEEIVCGTRGKGPCPDNMYCDWPDNGCGAVDKPGVCREIPRFCPEVFQPVCACDGQTYGNVCKAASVGVDASADCQP